MSKFDLGIIGLGSTGAQHLNYYKKNNEIKNIFISEVKKIKENKKLYNIDKNLLKFNQSQNKKILSISNFDNDHANLIIKNYFNCSIFVEKPMCRTIKDLNRIFKIIKKNKFKNLLYSNLVLRSSKVFNEVIKQIRAGEFGKIYYFEGDYLYGRLNKLNKGWRGLDPNYSVTLGGGIHLIDLMLNFFNELPTSVSSYSNKIVTKKSKFKYPDFTQSNFFFKNGSIAKITSNFGCVHKHQHVLKVFGTKKTFIYDEVGARFYKNYDPAKYKLKNVKKLYDGKAALLPDFFSKIKKKNKYKKHIYKELDLIAASIYADLSLKKNKKVKIRYKR